MTSLPPGVPAAAWSRGIGAPYENPGRPRVTMPMIDDGPWGGVPLGGLGAGSIGRTPRGDFARWHLQVGTHRFVSLPANQFSVFVSQGGHEQAHVLSPLRPEGLPWNFDLPANVGTYYALFPKAWYDYHWEALPVRLTQKQFSPVIPGNYQESSYPAGLFEWTVENTSASPVTVGLMFTWQNLIGQLWGQETIDGLYNYAVRQPEHAGVVLTRRGGAAAEDWDGSFAIAAAAGESQKVTTCSRFALDDAAGVWQVFAADGKLGDTDDQTPAAAGEHIGAAVAVTAELAPGETQSITFALAWDFPIVKFGSGRCWHKRYTKYFGTSGRDACRIAAQALASRAEWEGAIDRWQAPILADPGRPEWYKTALFNELYYLVDGGSLWDAGDDVGRFAFLECYDYPFYNTLDVNFYASYALLQLWPELEKSILRDFAATVPQSDPAPMEIESSGRVVQRKHPGALPHDLGGPAEDPLVRPNWYRFQDPNIWKDLNPKFVLQLWRDYAVTGDRSLVDDCWPAAVQALDYLRAADRDEDGLPEHDTWPDQTYDTWPMAGTSAYAGGLWLAALAAGVEMGKLQGDAVAAARFEAWLAAGKSAYEAKLWNGPGGYYNYDSSGGPHSDSIMADQLAGQWYADATGLAPIAPAEHVRSALRTIYEFNVMGFMGGQMGAVNGMRPDGMVDLSSEQSQEVWTGTSYALAAFMLGRGLVEEGWATGWGVYNVTYHRGYWFRTPEAYDKNGDFRASLYMRPLSIWAIEHALRSPHR